MSMTHQNFVILCCCRRRRRRRDQRTALGAAQQAALRAAQRVALRAAQRTALSSRRSTDGASRRSTDSASRRSPPSASDKWSAEAPNVCQRVSGQAQEEPKQCPCNGDVESRQHRSSPPRSPKGSRSASARRLCLGQKDHSTQTDLIKNIRGMDL